MMTSLQELRIVGTVRIGQLAGTSTSMENAKRECDVILPTIAQHCNQKKSQAEMVKLIPLDRWDTMKVRAHLACSTTAWEAAREWKPASTVIYVGKTK